MTDFSSCIRLHCFQFEKQGKTHRSSSRGLSSPSSDFCPCDISEIIYIYTHTYLKKRKKRKIVAILQGQKSLICIYTSCTNYINPMPIGCQSNGRSSESKRADDLKEKKEKKTYLPLDFNLRLRFHRGLEDAGQPLRFRCRWERSGGAGGDVLRWRVLELPRTRGVRDTTRGGERVAGSLLVDRREHLVLAERHDLWRARAWLLLLDLLWYHVRGLWRQGRWTWIRTRRFHGLRRANLCQRHHGNYLKRGHRILRFLSDHVVRVFDHLVEEKFFFFFLLQSRQRIIMYIYIYFLRNFSFFRFMSKAFLIAYIFWNGSKLFRETLE